MPRRTRHFGRQNKPHGCSCVPKSRYVRKLSRTAKWGCLHRTGPNATPSGADEESRSRVHTGSTRRRRMRRESRGQLPPTLRRKLDNPTCGPAIPTSTVGADEGARVHGPGDRCRLITIGQGLE